MRKRELGKSGFHVTTVGLGCEHLEGMAYDKVEAVVKTAIEHGINIFDVFMPEPNIRDHIGRAIGKDRPKVLLQAHIGAVYQNGQYKRSRDLVLNRKFFEDFCTRYHTDYVDIGMIHYVDTDADYQSVFASPIIEYVTELKRKGRIRLIGLSSHAPAIALRAVQTGLIDVLMFSINPAYDCLPAESGIETFADRASYGSDLCGIDPTRAALYSACEKQGTGVTVMKALASGRLLRENDSPFQTAFTVPQLIRYALDRPAVSSVLIGCRTKKEVEHAAAYDALPDHCTEYSNILAETPLFSMNGRCVYCNHCLPCPSKIDIAAVTKFLDMAGPQCASVPATVAEHYASLTAHASDCTACGICEKNCPFGVSIIENMKRAASLFE